jgi:hypothetical protein
MGGDVRQTHGDRWSSLSLRRGGDQEGGRGSDGEAGEIVGAGLQGPRRQPTAGAKGRQAQSPADREGVARNAGVKDGSGGGERVAVALEADLRRRRSRYKTPWTKPIKARRLQRQGQGAEAVKTRRIAALRSPPQIGVRRHDQDRPLAQVAIIVNKRGSAQAKGGEGSV